MPHQCINCERTFPDGSKRMLSGCPECGGNKFQYHPGSPDSDPDTEAGGVDDTETRGVTDADASADTDEVDPDPSAPPAPSSEDVADTTSVGTSDDPAPPDPASPAPDPSASESVARRVSQATATVREWVGSGREDSPPPTDDGGHMSDTASEVDASTADEEDAAQQSARTSMVRPEELPEPDPEPTSGLDPDPDPTPHGPGNAGSPTLTPTSAGESRAKNATPRPEGSSPDETASPEASPDLSQLREELNEQFESIKIVEPGQYELNLMELYDRQEHIVSLREDGRYIIDVPETWRNTGQD